MKVNFINLNDNKTKVIKCEVKLGQFTLIFLKKLLAQDADTNFCNWILYFILTKLFV